MTDYQIFALMPFVGALGLIAACDGRTKASRIAGMVWVAAWWFLPFAAILIKIKEVFG